ncbi:hypothetical protein P7C73_g190, partial [Tremellales sp. Uapishka_1]
MSLAPAQPEASSSKLPISIHVPTSLLVLPPTAATIGFLIGMSRGGSRARLRFLAENAHRPPKTVQGWYFYTKTRNYRVFFSALRTGGKYAAVLGAATSLYVVTDEAVGWARERVFPHLEQMEQKMLRVEGMPKREGWRKGPVHWEDGAVAGSLMGMVVGIAYRLPNPLMLRALVMGTILGSLTSTLQIAQAGIGKMRVEQELQEREKEGARDSVDAVPLPVDHVSIDPVVEEKTLTAEENGRGRPWWDVGGDWQCAGDQLQRGSFGALMQAARGTADLVSRMLPQPMEHGSDLFRGQYGVLVSPAHPALPSCLPTQPLRFYLEPPLTGSISAEQDSVGCIYTWEESASSTGTTNISEPSSAATAWATAASGTETASTTDSASATDSASSADPASATETASATESVSLTETASSTGSALGGGLFAGDSESSSSETRRSRTRTSAHKTTSTASDGWSSATSSDDWSSATTTTSSGWTASTTIGPSALAHDASGIEASISVGVSSYSSSKKHHKSSTSTATASASASDTSATSSSTANMSSGSTSFSAPHYVIYADNWLNTMPAASDLASYNRFILSFWMTNSGAVDDAQAWAGFESDTRSSVLQEYHDAGIALMVSAFGATGSWNGAGCEPYANGTTIPDSPTSNGADPTETAQNLAAWVKQYGLDGVDIDYEDLSAMNGGSAEAWLITFQTELRKQLPSPYLISHAPVAPWFTSADAYAAGAYVKVHQETGDGIDFYNVQFYNQGSIYEDCTTLITESGGDWPSTSVFEINSYAGVPLEKIVIGKPLDSGAADSGYMSASDLASCVSQATSKGWNAGVMFWEWTTEAPGIITAVLA